jgi:hypothetical protein
MEFRVASNLASFSSSGSETGGGTPQLRSPGRASRCGCELPRTLHLQALPAMDLRVASNLASFSATGIESPGRPASSLFQLRLPMCLPGCPSDCIFRLCRRWIFELPRISHPSALPALELWVAPRLRFPAAPPGVVTSCPARCTFRLCLGFEFPGCPEFPLPWRRLMVPRVTSVSAPSGLAVPASSGCPESSIYGLGR